MYSRISQAEQAKHWEEVKQLKASEAMLLEECDRLTQARYRYCDTDTVAAALLL